MSNEIVASAAHGVVLYAVVRSASAQPWNTGTLALESYTEANWASYAIALSEQGTCGIYVGSLPTQLAAGRYSIDVRQRLGSTAAPTDTRLGAGTIVWTGTAEAFVTSDASGRVTVASNADKTGYTVSTVQDKTGYSSTVAGYAGGQDPASLVLASSANKLLTNAAGQVQADLAQLVPTSNTAQTVGDALNAARAQGFGRWVLSSTTLTLYAPDGTTVVRVFTLNDPSNPTSRT